MRYLLHMTVNVPHDLDPAMVADLKTREKERALELQRAGVWLHLWRVAGKMENYSVVDATDHDHLHDLLLSLPLFPYLEIEVIPLAVHPSSLEAAGEG